MSQPSNKLQRRRELRQEATPAEKAMWRMLRNFQQQGRKFRRQHSIGPFIVDFCCVMEKLVVELDGQAHFNPGAQDYDYQRQQYLEREGYTVLRFENKQVFEMPEAVLQTVRNHFEENMAREQGLI